MSYQETQQHQAQQQPVVTSHYWGYRELSANEIDAVAGGDIGDYGDGGDRGYGDGASYAGTEGESYSSVSIDGVNYGLTITGETEDGMQLAGNFVIDLARGLTQWLNDNFPRDTQLNNQTPQGLRG